MKTLDSKELEELKQIAQRMRQRVIKTIHAAQCGHPGGSLSVAELLTALYFHTLRIDPGNPQWEDRDRFVLSKGHASIGLYCILAERGFFPVEELETFDSVDSRMQGHPDMHATPGVDMSTGSLGQGLSVGAGMALGARLLGKDFKTWVMIGGRRNPGGTDLGGGVYRGPLPTGQPDRGHGLQPGSADWVAGIPNPREPMEEPGAKFQSFGWRVLETDGHDFEAIIRTYDEARTGDGRPTVIVAHTVKGKGGVLYGRQLLLARHGPQ